MPDPQSSGPVPAGAARGAGRPAVGTALPPGPRVWPVSSPGMTRSPPWWVAEPWAPRHGGTEPPAGGEDGGLAGPTHLGRWVHLGKSLHLSVASDRNTHPGHRGLGRWNDTRQPVQNRPWHSQMPPADPSSRLSKLFNPLVSVCLCKTGQVILSVSLGCLSVWTRRASDAGRRSRTR